MWSWLWVSREPGDRIILVYFFARFALPGGRDRDGHFRGKNTGGITAFHQRLGNDANGSIHSSIENFLALNTNGQGLIQVDHLIIDSQDQLFDSLDLIAGDLLFVEARFHQGSASPILVVDR